MEGRVGDDGAQHLTDRPQAALAGRFGRLDDEGASAHPDDHPVTTAVERRGGVFDPLVGRRSARSQEA